MFPPLTFARGVNVVGQNLLLLVQFLQLPRVQHFAVHLETKPISEIISHV